MVKEVGGSEGVAMDDYCITAKYEQEYVIF